MKSQSFSLLIFILLLIPGQLPASDMVYLDITSPDARKLNIAVPWFVDMKHPEQLLEYGGALADSRGKALVFHGIFSHNPG